MSYINFLMNMRVAREMFDADTNDILFKKEFNDEFDDIEQ